MNGAKKLEVRGVQYELEVAINAPRDRVWEALTAEIQSWWLPDFHVTGQGSTMSLEPLAGGRFRETTEDGQELLWATVVWVAPGECLRMVGHAFPEWGGPSTSTIKFAIEEREGGGCSVKITDAVFGHVTDENIASLHEGWEQLLRDGLKRHVEAG